MLPLRLLLAMVQAVHVLALPWQLASIFCLAILETQAFCVDLDKSDLSGEQRNPKGHLAYAIFTTAGVVSAFMTMAGSLTSSRHV
jgi:hypothetical protein